MQQTLSCPSCGSPITDTQQFCGICGTQLLQPVQQSEIVQPVQTVPPETTTVPVTDTSSAVIEDVSRTVPDTQYQTAGAPVVETTQSTERTAPATRGTSATVWSEVGPPRKTGILRVAGVLFQVIGWIVLVLGCLAFIAMAVFAFLGGQLVSLIPGVGNLAGNEAITIALIGLVMSIIYGFALLAFSEMCFILIDINKAVRLPK